MPRYGYFYRYSNLIGGNVNDLSIRPNSVRGGNANCKADVGNIWVQILGWVVGGGGKNSNRTATRRGSKRKDLSEQLGRLSKSSQEKKTEFAPNKEQTTELGK